MNISYDNYIKITWSAAGVFICVLISVVLWLASTDSKATDAINRLDRQKDSIKEMRQSVQDIDKRTIRIETILNEMRNKSL